MIMNYMFVIPIYFSITWNDIGPQIKHIKLKDINFENNCIHKHDSYKIIEIIVQNTKFMILFLTP